MMPVMFRRASFAVVALGAALSCLSGAAAEAASLPAHAQVRAGWCVEPASFRGLVANRYHVEFERVVATDIDRDGDIDVVATTDDSFTVWVNDGDGHLTAQPAPQGPALEGRAPTSTWRDHGTNSEPTTYDGSTPTVTLVVQAHAPPAIAGRRAMRLDTSALLSYRTRLSVPRAPPAL
jgi:hypothetical protein